MNDAIGNSTLLTKNTLPQVVTLWYRLEIEDGTLMISMEIEGILCLVTFYLKPRKSVPYMCLAWVRCLVVTGES